MATKIYMFQIIKTIEWKVKIINWGVDACNP